jgi:hypothetical protein
LRGRWPMLRGEKSNGFRFYDGSSCFLLQIVASVTAPVTAED